VDWNGLDGSATEGQERIGKERNGKDGIGAERQEGSGTERRGKDRSGKERTGRDRQERTGADGQEWTGEEWKGRERIGGAWSGRSGSENATNNKRKMKMKKANTEAKKIETKEPMRVMVPNFELLTVKIHNPEGVGLMTHRRPPESDMGNPDNPENVALREGGKVERSNRKIHPLRDKLQEARHSFYEIPGKTNIDKILEGKPGVIGLPASGFGKSLRTTAMSPKYAKTELNGEMVKRNVFVLGGFNEWVEAHCPKGAYIDERIVLIGKGQNKSPQMRYRPMFPEWNAELRIKYDADVFSAQDIVNLLIEAGIRIGWGENRPEKGYSNGMWELDFKSIRVEKYELPKWTADVIKRVA